MQRVDAVAGLAPAPEAERRCEVVPIVNANPLMAEGLYAMWANKTTVQAHDALARDDVTVTNQKDKMKQLTKLLRLNDDVCDAAAAVGGRAAEAASDQASDATTPRMSKARTPPSAVAVARGGSARRPPQEVEMEELAPVEAV